MTMGLPFGMLMTTPAVRRHLLRAGRELALAVREGLAVVATSARDSRLAAEYPYVESALRNLSATVERWVHALREPRETARRERRGQSRTKKKP
ncbi:MAG: hypothetical protein HY543_08080 [Deltaproteobacteria bacterium]|nr:hypothetical protein [Deltaproteobacteria bacterium]